MSRGDLDGADADAVAAMATDETGEALELRAWAARNRHDLDGAIRLGRAAAGAATDPTIRASSLIAVAFGHRGNGDLRQAEAVLDEAAGAPAELGLPAWTGVLRVHQGRPADGLATLEPMLGAEARRGGQGYWVEHTLQMTAHAYGLLGRSADALRRAGPARARDRAARHRGAVRRRPAHLPAAGSCATSATPAPRSSRCTGLGLAGSQEILAQCHLDVADCLLRAGDLAGAADRLAVAETESGTRWFHNKWRFDQRRGCSWPGSRSPSRTPRPRSTRRSRWPPPPRSAVTPATPCSARLVRATAQARLGEPVDEAAARRRPRRPGRGGRARGLVAGRRRGRRDRIGVRPGHRATRLAEHVAREAAEHGEAFRTVAAAPAGAQATATASTTTGANRSPVRRTASTASATSASRASALSVVDEARAGAAPRAGSAPRRRARSARRRPAPR